MCALKVLGRNKREEIGFSVRNLPGQIIVETEKVLEMFECVGGDFLEFVDI